VYDAYLFRYIAKDVIGHQLAATLEIAKAIPACLTHPVLVARSIDVLRKFAEPCYPCRNTCTRQCMAQQLTKVGSAYQKIMFNFHHHNFFPLWSSMSLLEQEYLLKSWDSFGLDSLQQTSYLNSVRSIGASYKFNQAAFSHRVKGSQHNAARYAAGVAMGGEEVAIKAWAVLEDYGVNFDALPPHVSPYLRRNKHATIHMTPGVRFLGLGWDLQADELRLYLVANTDALAPMHRHVFHKYESMETNVSMCDKPPPLYDTSIVSFTISRQKRQADRHVYLVAGKTTCAILETKIYIYPTKPKCFQGVTADVEGLALMFSSARGLVLQMDINMDGEDESQLTWRHRLNKVGQQIMDTYADVDQNLYTVNWKNKDDFTIYFDYGGSTEIEDDHYETVMQQ